MQEGDYFLVTLVRRQRATQQRRFPSRAEAEAFYATIVEQIGQGVYVGVALRYFQADGQKHAIMYTIGGFPLASQLCDQTTDVIRINSPAMFAECATRNHRRRISSIESEAS